MLETAEIIAVGSELLTPHRIDTNSLFLTARLNELGLTLRAKTVVGDDAASLGALFRASLDRSDVVITTGGLGPTHDDLTREVLAEALGRPLEQDAAVLDAIQARFAKRGVPMPAINSRQAMVISGALVLENPNGTAPGQFLEHDGRIVILLPGPPRELEPMFDERVRPRLEARIVRRRQLHRRVLKITGRSESQVADVAGPVYSKISTPHVQVDTSILAAPGQIEIHLTGMGMDADVVRDVLDAGVDQLLGVLGAVVFSTDGRSLEAVVGQLLAERRWRLAAAESCTGGMLLGRLTDVAGSSAWVVGGVVAYDNAIKISALGVDEAAIAQQGAVSEAVGAAMATGVRERMSADVGVAITGVAGPGGGSADKPVGMVVISVAAPAVAVRTYRFTGDREMVRRQATTTALDMVRRVLLGVSLDR